VGITPVLHIADLPRSYRNWKRKRYRIRPNEIVPPFFYAKDIHAVQQYFSTTADSTTVTAEPSLLVGSCFICNESVEFHVGLPNDAGQVNWRETLTCPKCGLINRWRSCLHLFEALCEPTVNDRIYLTEMLSPIYKNLVDRFPLLIGSEFLPNAELGSSVKAKGLSVRNEDVTQLSFKSGSFESVLCFDVLEHVPDYRLALKEFFRVLCNGGQLVLSVPFSFRQVNIVRAKIDQSGNVKHLLEPCYHGDPLSDHGVLSYYDFGMELLDEMREAGFQESFLICYHSKEWGYLSDNIAFVARK
jgi:SAM-dependent methyltransferase